MRSNSLGSRAERTVVRAQRAPPITEQVTRRNTTSRCARTLILVLYSLVTILDLARGIIHTFLYETGIQDISGLGTGDALCDARLSALMIAYGGANLESVFVRSYILYRYARYGSGRGAVRASGIAAASWVVVAWISSADVDVGDADVPGRYAMLARAIVSLVTALLTIV